MPNRICGYSWWLTCNMLIISWITLCLKFLSTHGTKYDLCFCLSDVLALERHDGVLVDDGLSFFQS